MAAYDRAMSFKPPLEMVYAIERAGEDAELSNAEVVKQLVQHGLNCIQSGDLKLKPRPFIRRKSITKRIEEEGATHNKIGDSIMAAPENPKGP